MDTSDCLYKQIIKNEFLIFGSSLHSAIEDIILNKRHKIAWGKVFEQKLKEESNEILLKSYFGRQFSYQGTAILKELNFFERFKDYEIIGVELEMYEPLFEDENVRLYFKGIIDLVLKHKTTGRYLILDWKSANTLWNLEKQFNLKETSKNVFEFQKEPKDKAFFGQLALYKHFYSQKFGVPIEDIDTSFIALSRDPINCQRYDIEISKYQYLSFYELVPVIYNQMHSIVTNQTKADSIVSVDEREYIFRGKSLKLDNLRKLLAEVEGIFNDLKIAIRV